MIISVFIIKYGDFEVLNYDSDQSVWLSRKLSGVDSLADKYPSMSGYMYVGGHPLVVTDPNGMDWYIDGDGVLLFDENVRSQADLDSKKINGSYLFAEGFDSRENFSGKNVKLNADGTRDYNSYEIAIITPESKEESAYSDNYVQDESKGGFWVLGNEPRGFNPYAIQERNWDGTIEVEDPIDMAIEYLSYEILKIRRPFDDEAYIISDYTKADSSVKKGDTLGTMKCYKSDSIGFLLKAYPNHVNYWIVDKNKKK